MYERYIKRLLDIILSLAATIILAIPMGIVALWIKIDSPSAFPSQHFCRKAAGRACPAPTGHQSFKLFISPPLAMMFWINGGNGAA